MILRVNKKENKDEEEIKTTKINSFVNQSKSIGSLFYNQTHFQDQINKKENISEEDDEWEFQDNEGKNKEFESNDVQNKMKNYSFETNWNLGNKRVQKEKIQISAKY